MCNCLGAGSSGVIGRDIHNIACRSSLLRYGSNVVGVGERILSAGVTQLLKQRLDGIDLVLGVRLSRAVQQTYVLGIREQLLEHVCLTVERCKIGSTGDVGTGLAGPVGYAECGAVVGYRSAEDRNIRGAGLCSLQSRGSVRHNEVHTRGNKAVYDGGAVCGLAGGVLRVKLDLATVSLDQLLQLILETLRSRIQRLMLNQLNNAYLIAASRTGIAAGGCIAVIAAGAAAAAGSHRECHGASHQRCE